MSARPFALDGRVAIVTGGAQGLGRAYAKAFAEAGAIPVIADLNIDGARAVAGEIERSGGRAMAVQTDVGDEASTLAMAAEVEARFGRIDALVNNAALYMRNLPPATHLIKRPFDQIPLAEWDLLMRVNVTGAFLCARAVTPAMRRVRYGRIVNISSSTVLLGLPNYLHYVTSKAAVIGFTRSLARELGKDGVTVNTVIPGLVSTEIDNPTTSPDRVVPMQCVPRPATPEDLTGAILFLCSEESRFVTGQSVNIDGGSAHV
jgi:NAD(P)-dependent dehydrogenase (short-subunit alcohol dehydrogenase family)